MSDPASRARAVAVAKGLAAVIPVAGSVAVAWLEHEEARTVQARESEVVRTLVGVIEAQARGCE